MASAIIHICIAKELNKYLHMDERKLFLGSIAPDISKHLGESKEISHFLNPANDDGIPQIDKFLEKINNILGMDLGIDSILRLEQYTEKDNRLISIKDYLETYE